MDLLNVQKDNPLAEILKSALDTELTVSQHYWARAAAWRARGWKKLAEAYEKEADEERGHARVVADRMAFLRIPATPSPDPGPTIDDLGNIVTHVMDDLTGEVNVANTYQGWVQAALEAKDFATADILKRILRETEEHVGELQAELEKMEAMGEGVYLATWAVV